MQFILAPSSERPIADLSRRLTHELQAGRQVLWLLSGGSNIPLSVQVMQRLPADLTKALTISLVDERYGPPGHVNSNWQQLEANNFVPQQAHLLPVLQSDLNFGETREHYEHTLSQAWQAADCIIAQLGIGDDGHVAGILPHSIAAAAANNSLVVAYHSNQYERLSLTFEALKRLTAAYAVAFGKSKESALSLLANRSLALAEQPAQILKQLTEAYVYNDQVGEI